jgi:hypothetical protein
VELLNFIAGNGYIVNLLFVVVLGVCGYWLIKGQRG